MLAESPTETSQEDKMSLALEQVGLSELPIAHKLKEIMENAITSTPDGQLLPDYKAMLEAIRLWYKLRNKGPDTVIQIANIMGNWSGSL